MKVRKDLNALNFENGQHTETGSEILSEIMRIHFPDSTSDNLDAATSTTIAFNSSRQRWNLADDIITYDSILCAIDSFDPYIQESGYRWNRTCFVTKRKNDLSPSA